MNFYDTYKDFTKDELFQIIFSPDEYQPEAIDAARQVITEKGWTEDLRKRSAEEKIKDDEEQHIYEQDIEEKAAYYKSALEFKQQRNSFYIRIADVPKFEAKLAEQGIEFFREDKNIGVQLDSYPTQTYYFKNEDTDAVDEISKQLGLITAPYADTRPFFGFEIKVIVIVVAIMVVILFLFKLFN